MSTQQLQAPAPRRRSSSLVWWLLGSALLALVGGLVIYNVSQLYIRSGDREVDKSCFTASGPGCSNARWDELRIRLQRAS